MKKIMLVAGARPNFMKIAPIMRAIKASGDLQAVLVHTGQHYDKAMSGNFFTTLGIPEPDHNLEVGSGTHAVQTANIMIRFEEVCMQVKPDLVAVVGDVNSTVAAGLVAKKLHIPLAHVEAGLRSGDRTMPEEINRLATDAISDLFFTTEKEGTDNLLREGQSGDKVHFVGHVMIDNLLYQLQGLSEDNVSSSIRQLKERLDGKRYVCVTLHRPSNVDNKDNLSGIITALQQIAQEIPVIFPCHPRTLKQMQLFGLADQLKSLQEEESVVKGMYLLNPLDYNDFLYVWKDSAGLITDSGGLQEETTALKVPCITVRENTERPITAEIGSNEVVGTDSTKILSFGKKMIAGEWKSSEVPPLWDGKASERIVTILERFLKG